MPKHAGKAEWITPLETNPAHFGTPPRAEGAAR